MWKKDLESVLESHRVREPVGKFAMAKRLLAGDPLTNFENSIALK